MLLYRDNPFCPLSNYPIYPPYANGAYLEDYFAMRFVAEGRQNDIERKYIQVLWTPYYIERNITHGRYRDGIPDEEPLQSELNSMDPNKQYFVVSQHDDAPMHRLPENTLVFSAGGNYDGPNTCIPIPLICSKIPNHLIPDIEERDILVSFIGSETHPVRRRAIDSINGNDRVVVESREEWNENVPMNDLIEFLTITSRSEFCLCPRGYGKSSFRLYECMQMGTIPVYVSGETCPELSDEHYLPWSDELDWNEFCVLVNQEEIPDIYNRLNSMTEETKKQMRNKLEEVYDKYFSLSGMYDNIMKRVENIQMSESIT